VVDSIRNSSKRALNPARRVESPTGIILKWYTSAEQRGIISNVLKEGKIKLFYGVNPWRGMITLTHKKTKGRAFSGPAFVFG